MTSSRANSLRPADHPRTGRSGAALRTRDLLVTLLVIITFSVSAPGALAQGDGTTFGGVEFPEGEISFADRVVSYTGAEGVSEPNDDPGRALGPPDAAGEMVSLGNAESQCQTSLVLEFVDNYLVDVDGDDIWIFEIGPAVEATELFISVDAVNWIAIGKVEGSTRGVDIAGFVSEGQRFPFIRLCDFPDGNTSGAPFAGPDITAVGAIGSVIRPPGEQTNPPATTSGDPTSGTDPTSGGAIGSDTPGSTYPPPPFGSPEPWPIDRMTIQATQRQVVSGGFVWVPVYLLRSNDVANINFEITYDSNIAVTEGDLVSGNLLGGRLFSANPGERGIVRVGFSGTDGVFGTGTVAWIPFRAVGLPGQRTVLSITVSTINEPNGAEPVIDRINGAVIIVDEAGLVPGDCDGNGYLTEFDAYCALQMSVQLRPVLITLDIDGDGQVTSRDATVILQRVTGRG